MTGFRKKQRMEKPWFKIAAILFVCMLCVAGGFAEKKAHSKSAMETTPIGTEIKVVIPDSLGDKNDDSMRVKVTKYTFEGNGKADYYYLNIEFEFTSLGKGQKSWESKAVFYDKQGKVMNREGTVDGYIWSYGTEKAAALGETYSHKVYVPSALAGDVMAIAFQEHYKEPSTLPANPSMAAPSYWDDVKVTYPASIASIQDDTMRARITDYHFENSETGDSYYLYINMEFTSLGKTGSMWASKALFYDQYGYLIEGGVNDNYGFFSLSGSTTTIALGRTYTMAIEIPAEIRDSVASIVFMEKWNGTTVPATIPTAQPAGNQKKQTITAKNQKKELGSKSFKLKPGGKFYSSLKFKSSNTKIATVTSHKTYATVKLKKAGEVKITITAPATAKYSKASKTIKLTVILSKPKLTIKKTAGKMTLSWSKVKGASEYWIYVNGSSKPYRYSKSSLRDAKPYDNGKIYEFRMRTIASNKKYSSGWVKKTVRT
ncbi:MAG: hypothetical protein IJ733_14700 [Lachnospiraceae bacterium]|nr:hypothetical protein [Lachnospiraceae bacterium]